MWKKPPQLPSNWSLTCAAIKMERKKCFHRISYRNCNERPWNYFAYLIHSRCHNFGDVVLACIGAHTHIHIHIYYSYDFAMNKTKRVFCLDLFNVATSSRPHPHITSIQLQLQSRTIRYCIERRNEHCWQVDLETKTFIFFNISSRSAKRKENTQQDFHSLFPLFNMNAKDTNAHYVIVDGLNRVLCTHINGMAFIRSATT